MNDSLLNYNNISYDLYELLIKSPSEQDNNINNDNDCIFHDIINNNGNSFFSNNLSRELNEDFISNDNIFNEYRTMAQTNQIYFNDENNNHHLGLLRQRETDEDTENYIINISSHNSSMEPLSNNNNIDSNENELSSENNREIPHNQNIPNEPRNMEEAIQIPSIPEIRVNIIYPKFKVEKKEKIYRGKRKKNKTYLYLPKKTKFNYKNILTKIKKKVYNNYLSFINKRIKNSPDKEIRKRRIKLKKVNNRSIQKRERNRLNRNGNETNFILPYCKQL